MESYRLNCRLPMSLLNLGLLTLSLVILCSPCSAQDDFVLQHCDTSAQFQFRADCSVVGVILIKQVYFGVGSVCPPNNPATCVLLTERLRLNCNRLATCATPAGIPQQCGGDTVNVQYTCIPIVSLQVKALTNASMSGSAVSLRTARHPSEADDVDRQMCRVNIIGHGAISIDFLDLSYNGNIAQGSPYCVYWGESDFVCARKAYERQMFEVRTHSNSQNIPLTLLFWSNNYSKTTTARFWIEIRAIESTSLLRVECGLSVLDYPSIATPEPYWLPTTPGYQPSPPALTGEIAMEEARGTNINCLVAAITATLTALFSLGILIILLYVYCYERLKKRQPSAAQASLPTTTTFPIYNMPSDTDHGYMDIQTSAALTPVNNSPIQTDHAYMDMSTSAAYSAIDNIPNETNHEYKNISSSGAVGTVIPESQYEIPKRNSANGQETRT